MQPVQVEKAEYSLYSADKKADDRHSTVVRIHNLAVSRALNSDFDIAPLAAQLADQVAIFEAAQEAARGLVPEAFQTSTDLAQDAFDNNSLRA